MTNNNVLKIGAPELTALAKAMKEKAKEELQIAGKGGSPGQPYDPPKEDPKNPYVPAPTRKLAAANNIRETSGPLANDDSYGEGNVPGHPDWKLSGGPQLPNFKPMGRVIKGVREGVLPMKDTKIKQQLQIGPQAGATSRQIRDRLKPFTKGKGYDKEGGSLRDIPDSLRIQLLRDAMARNKPANNIRRLQDTGHMTIPENADGTGRLRIIDLLGPQNPPQA